MAGLSDFAEDKIIDVLLRNTAYTGAATVYATIHTADPTDTGTANAGITRVAATFSAPSGGATSNSGTVTFTSVTAGTYTHCSVWDAPTGGNMLLSGALTASKTADTGDNISFAATTLVVTAT